MPDKPDETRVPDRDDLGRPSARDTVARARAAAGPAAAKASAAAGPALEKAATKAGKLLGTLRSRAQETVKEFSDAYGKEGGSAADGERGAEGTATTDDPPAGQDEPAAERRRPRPGPA